MRKSKLNEYKEKAHLVAEAKITYFNQFYHFQFNKISIKKHKRRWGSCSTKKNVNFNYKMIFLRNQLVDYLIVHELCHLKEMNHSKNFWGLVAKTIPNYKILNRELKKINILQVAKLGYL